MKRRTGFTLIELLVVIAIIAVLAAILFPVFSRVRKTAFAANCQSNMKQIGSSVKMYLTDWDDTYPTNRTKNTNGTVGIMCYQVQLSPEPTTTTTDPPRFVNSFNWVEGLYSYIERVAGKDEASSVWRCQAASNKTAPATGALSTTAAVTYAFNGYLCEQPEGVVKVSANTMMVREIDRIINAELRPWNMAMHAPGGGANNGVRQALGTNADRPIDAFLNITDMVNGTTTGNPNNSKQHAKGSHILFADGHVKFFSTTVMPRESDVTTTRSWDADTEQWYNFKKSTPVGQPIANPRERSIGITP